MPAAAPRARPPHRRIGLLGGSFNPAHAGHRAISLEALRRLRLDAVWWLVAPQNPLKDTAETAPYEQRLAGARVVADHPLIVACDLERRHGLAYTVETIAFLRARRRNHAFVWLMGADAFCGLHRWKDWTRIMEAVPVVVIDRPGHTLCAASSRAAVRYRRFRLDETDAAALPGCDAPGWALLHGPLRGESSTAIRAQMNG